MGMFGQFKRDYKKAGSWRRFFVRKFAKYGHYIGRHQVEWTALRDRYKGQCGFVLGNGPSLQVRDLDSIAGQIAVASNKIYLAYPETRFRPTIYTCVDRIVAENSLDQVCGLSEQKYLPDSLIDLFGLRVDITYWIDESGFIGEDTLARRFSSDVRKCVYNGHTVIYNNLQIAYHLGLEVVYLIGMDFSFNVPSTRKDHSYGTATVAEGEVNHFHPDYRKPGEIWTLPDLERQKAAFESAKSFYESHGRKIYNATRGGKLEVFERVDLDEVIAGLSKNPRAKVSTK